MLVENCSQLSDNENNYQLLRSSEAAITRTTSMAEDGNDNENNYKQTRGVPFDQILWHRANRHLKKLSNKNLNLSSISGTAELKSTYNTES